MLTKYGEFEFTYQDEVFKGKPSFANISKIGTPSQIIHAVKMLNIPMHSYHTARMILNCCIDGDLPWFNDDEGINRLGARRANNETRAFVVTMAKHCIQHGICGNVKSELSRDKKQELAEFDPYEFIESAIELLGLSMEEAANLSMTEYISRIKVKPWYKEARDKESKKVPLSVQRELLDEQREMDRKLRERLARN